MRSYILALALLLVAAPAHASSILISQYVEGSGNNNALEFWNYGSTDQSLSGWSVEIYLSGNTTADYTISLTGSVLAMDVFVLTHALADPPLLALADQTSTDLRFNGDDAIVLRDDMGNVVDSIGEVGFDPGIEWGSGLLSTKHNTFWRYHFNLTADTDPSDAYTIPSSGWWGAPKDEFFGLGVTPIDEAPEPETAAMLLLGLVSLAIMGRRRRAATPTPR